MEDRYIRPIAIYRKLRIADKENRPIYISAALSYGKTEAVRHFYSRKRVLWLTGRDGFIDVRPNIEEIEESIVVIDDISWITDEETRRYIIDLLTCGSGKHFVLIGRGKLPSYLRTIALDQDFVMAGETDLALDKDDTAAYLKSRGYEYNEEEVSAIREMTKGHAMALKYLCDHLEAGTAPGDEAFWQMKMEMFRYFDQDFWKRWDPGLQRLCLALCNYESFTIRMAEMVTGDNRIPELLERAVHLGTFLIRSGEDRYEFRIELRNFCKWKQSLVWTNKQILDNYHRAAWYYELEDDIVEALTCLQKAGDEEQIIELLIKNAQKLPGNAHYFETRKFYFELPQELMEKSPVLMSGMSMLYSIIMQPDKSEIWYGKLAEFEKRAEKGSREKREALERLIHLDISLPHRGVMNISKLLIKVAKSMKGKPVTLPEFSVTSNNPSLMNGGKDFSEWSRNDRKLALILKQPIELVLGKTGVGLVTLALAESGMENGTMSSYEIISRANEGYVICDSHGKTELCFVATGILVREHVAQGKIGLAEDLLIRFKKKALSEAPKELISNIDTMAMWLGLLKGDISKARAWLSTAPDEVQAFCILDRYRYIHKIRCLIALDRKEEALSLAEKLDVFFSMYERHYLWMENQLLKSILLYRMNSQHWMDSLERVLKKAEYFHFSRVISKEGIAVKPLIDKYNEKKKQLPVDPGFFRGIKEQSDAMAVYYPNYLRVAQPLKAPLTPMEKQVLKLMCDGMTTKQICTLCNFSESSLKQHRWNIFRKLGVKSRQQAEKEAIRLGLDR